MCWFAAQAKYCKVLLNRDLTNIRDYKVPLHVTKACIKNSLSVIFLSGNDSGASPTVDIIGGFLANTNQVLSIPKDEFNYDSQMGIYMTAQTKIELVDFKMMSGICTNKSPLVHCNLKQLKKFLMSREEKERKMLCAHLVTFGLGILYVVTYRKHRAAIKQFFNLWNKR